MNDRRRLKEEYLERLWHMRSEDKNSMDLLKNVMGENFDTEMVDELLSEDLVELTENNNKLVHAKAGIVNLCLRKRVLKTYPEQSRMDS